MDMDCTTLYEYYACLSEHYVERMAHRNCFLTEISAVGKYHSGFRLILKHAENRIILQHAVL